DLTHIDEPSYPFIATIIEASAKVRTRDGDIKIINASDTANQLIASFNSYSYLNIANRDEN
ncbi:MAG: hypothetical protein SCK70_06540, partial [bacterium]|nr:hypothetical protein [bacterium]